MAQWIKQGQLYALPSGGLHPKLLSHAANPLPLRLDDDIYRIFYCARDEHNRSSVGAVDVDIVQHKVVCEHTQPFFEFGPPGSFYADGISIGNCYEANGKLYMLFMGWQSPKGGHWRGDIGRLLVKPDFTLELDTAEPLIGASSIDPISLAYPWVMRLPDSIYRMWYPSVISWETSNGEMLAVLHGADSNDGNNWRRTGLAVPYELGKAQAFSRPTVVRRPWGEYQMWFSYRSGMGASYRIGLATSKDALDWKLDLSNAGIDVSADGWDSEMIEYPFVFAHKEKLYMLYNGNGYGKTGFGLASQAAC